MKKILAMNRRTVAVMILFSLILPPLLGGCAGARPFTYQDPVDMPPGPGIFSGQRGAFVLLGPNGKNDGKRKK